MKMFAKINWFYVVVVIFAGLLFKILFYRVLRRPLGSKLSARFIGIFTGLKPKVIGALDPDAQMLIINHQSELDIGILESALDEDLVWVAKKELFEVPFFSLAVKVSEDIALERNSKSALVSLLKQVKDRVEKGRIVCIFPEGTRSESGKMLPFKQGAKIIADKYALRVQPVVIVRSSHYFSNKTHTARAGKIKIVFLESFIADRSDKEWLKELRVKMQEAYDAHLKD